MGPLYAPAVAASIRILCVDDDLATNRLHALLLGAESDMEVVGMVGDVPDVLPAVERLQPDVVLLDLSLRTDRSDGLLGEIVQRHPGVCVVVLSGFDQPETVDRLFAVGASGFIAKAVEPQAIAEAVRMAVRGERPRVGGSFPRRSR